MKKLTLITMAAIILSGCSVRNDLKHLRSSLLGLDRKITLYAADGKIMKEWRTTAKVEDRGGTIWFICDGKAITVSGTFTVEEM